jgi:predicted nucleic acid-binding protein
MINMPGKPVILIDLNILLDVLQKREPFYEDSAKLLASVETGQVQGFIAAHSMTTLFYLIQKGRSSAEAHAILTGLLQFLQIAPVDQNTIEQALNLDLRDFEDAVQMVSALQCKADYLITRNIKDYPVTILPVMKPIDYLATIQ